MADTLKPRDAKEVEDAVRWALGNDKALEVAGQGTKRAIGRPSQTDLTLDLSGLSGVTLYEPEELVLSARRRHAARRDRGAAREKQPGARLRADGLRPAAGRQRRAAARIGGAIAANLSGPRRIKAGAARDHFLGVTAVTGRGETIKSGGRVVKNVTGYDMCKLLAGSWGTLAAMTDITDQGAAEGGDRGDRDGRGPRRRARLRGHGGRHGLVVRCLRRGASARSCRVLVRRPAQAGGCRPCLRLEGFAPSVAHRKEALAALLKPFGAGRRCSTKRNRARCGAACAR